MYRATIARNGSATIGHPFLQQLDIYMKVTYQISHSSVNTLHMTAQFVLVSEPNQRWPSGNISFTSQIPGYGDKRWNLRQYGSGYLYGHAIAELAKL